MKWRFTWRNIKKSFKNKKFKISSPIRNDEFELPDRSYSVSNIQGFFKYNDNNYIKNNITMVTIYVNKITELRSKLKQNILSYIFNA